MSNLISILELIVHILEVVALIALDVILMRSVNRRGELLGKKASSDAEIAGNKEPAALVKTEKISGDSRSSKESREQPPVKYNYEAQNAKAEANRGFEEKLLRDLNEDYSNGRAANIPNTLLNLKIRFSYFDYTEKYYGNDIYVHDKFNDTMNASSTMVRLLDPLENEPNLYYVLPIKKPVIADMYDFSQAASSNLIGELEKIAVVERAENSRGAAEAYYKVRSKGMARELKR
ncbi:MAG: hypothetical protein LBU32_29110 [Clostridiales bacterium]|jgi:hypothetical protein|nr:hypothetical protein [Clostridiales bacterium]